ncbi:hypothetical protein OGAPHI_004870 [Ogataea philodendri]|uniref:RING-CH-type domain-containing protein n=1 Tax=Ogataea philodendri TaxID=1378263 RepID=A0A9P8T2Z3_9ASCO|nr:uncharacterized protein OGAPHI_004870 [Ogataea philodendri]KAH3664156.1 hypothetical protein OGAPHI_004870 [Ogataea philodendri]
MQSLTSLPDDSEYSCYICLAGRGELAPFCNSEESKDWVKPCQCSLVAHRKCFLSWVSSLDLQKRKQQENPETLPSGVRSATLMYNYNIQSLLFGFPLIKKSETITVFIDCPQCKRQICFQTPNSRILNLRQTISSGISNIMRVGISSTVISSSLASVSMGFLVCLSATGFRVMQMITPQSVQLSLFDVNRLNTRTLISALDDGSIPIPKFLMITGSIPLYLIYMRMSVLGTGPFNMVGRVFPLLLFKNQQDLIDNPAKKLLLLTLPLQYIYRAFYSLTFNRIYYKWCKQVQPCFIADRLSLKELERIEEENREEDEYHEAEKESHKLEPSHTGLLGIIRRYLNLVFSHSGLRSIRFSRLRRELINCFKFDYARVFQNSQFFLFLATTMSWPYFGELISRTLLAKIPNINSFLQKYINTPDESEFLRNLIGCVVVVLAKDLINLYFNYKKFKQLKEVDVVSGSNEDFLRYISEKYNQGEPLNT